MKMIPNTDCKEYKILPEDGYLDGGKPYTNEELDSIGYGYNASALMRAYLNLAGIDWSTCEKLGAEFNAQIETAQWLSTDTGMEFYKHERIENG
jgi:hypothetical protein